MRVIPLTIIMMCFVKSSFLKTTIAIDEKFVCVVKKNCEDCLRLQQCSWCPTENKCFSPDMDSDFCTDNKIDHEDLGLSYEENAQCLCRGDKYVNATTCFPPTEDDQTPLPDQPVCSGHGKCICGRCFCDPTPDPEQPTKMVMGDHCEFDNFSCQDECNEGPYLINTNDVVSEKKTDYENDNID